MTAWLYSILNDGAWSLQEKFLFPDTYSHTMVNVHVVLGEKLISSFVIFDGFMI